MALIIHSIPAMSSEAETVLCSSKLLISDHCNRLGDGVISTVEGLKSWERAGLIEMKEIQQVEDLQVVLEKRKELVRTGEVDIWSLRLQ